jgi:hypothetical protein
MIATSWLAPGSWQEHQEKAIREAIRASVDWMEYLRMVDRHRTPALSWAALKRVPGLEIPESARRELQKRSDACRLQAVRCSVKLAQVLRGFNQAGIPVMTFKGPFLSLELYGDLGLRQSKDIDLACTLEDISRAQACLETLGWHLDSGYFPLTPRQWEGFIRHEYHIGFVHSSGGCGLELHWRNHGDTPVQVAAQWARCIPSVWQGCSCLTMNSVDLVLYLSSHGGRHAWMRAKWLGDMARIRAQEKVDWQATMDQALKEGHDRPLLAVLCLLEYVYGLPVPDLRGDPWKKLPRFLIDSPLRVLKVAEDPAARGILAVFEDGFRLNRYDGLVLPHRTWRDILAEFAYRRADFRVVRLPDSLFWAYALLRPILLLWRRVLGNRPADG